MRRLATRQACRGLGAFGDLCLHGPRTAATSAFKALSAASRDQGGSNRWAAQEVAACWRPSNLRFSTATAADSSGLQQFRLAQTGEGIKECELIQWFVKEGDAVEEFGRICEVQSDKATVEITSPFAGTVQRLHYKPGDVVQVGEVLADIQAEAGTQTPKAAAAAAAVAAEAISASHAATVPPEVGAGASGSKVLTSPAVRALAHEHGVDLALVAPSGPGGRITKGDVMAHIDSLAAGPTPSSSSSSSSMVGRPAMQAAAPSVAEQAQAQEPPPQQQPAAQPPPPRGPLPPPLMAYHEAAGAPAPTLIPLRGYRKAMVRSMEAAGKVPHFHYCDEVDVGRLVELREELRHDPVLGGAKLTYLPFFMKAAALALREFPLVNASLAPDGSAIVQHNAVNMGIAVSTPYGLVVPVVRAVQWKSISALAAELSQLQRAAAENKLSQEQVSGGTFTVSNIGTIGGTYATPLVNPPEVAIMALGRIQRLPRFGPDGNVVGAEVMGVSLGADHRVVDGATLAGFAKAWRHFVEAPGALLLHLQ